jgi:hypothetical protein
MEDYRSAHHAKYLERIQELEEIEKLLLGRSQKIEKLKKLVEDIKTQTTMNQIKTTVNEMLETIESDEALDKQKLSQIGLDLVETINTNKFTMTDFNNHVHVLMSRDVHAIVKSILSLCGIDDNIEVQYEMDCSQDEEIARRMSMEPPVLRRRRARPVSARPRRGQMAL